MVASKGLLLATSVFMSLRGVRAFDFNMSRTDNTVAYWGQNSRGAANGQDTASFQKNLGEYCDDYNVDTFAISFLTVFFGPGGLPQLDLANICSAVTHKTFGDSQLPDCSFLAEDIKKCQSAGKTVLLSMGGATGGSTFTSAQQATDFADQIWNLFMGGQSETRPFGDAVLDGVDLDIEGGGTPLFADFVKHIRKTQSSRSQPIPSMVGRALIRAAMDANPSCIGLLGIDKLPDESVVCSH